MDVAAERHWRKEKHLELNAQSCSHSLFKQRMSLSLGISTLEMLWLLTA